MRMKCVLGIFISGVMLALPIYAHARDENIITAISIEGLKRTKPHVAERLLQKYIGRDADDININDVHAAMQGINSLEPVSIEIIDSKTGGGKTLAVSVREKWSIFPVPFFLINSDKWFVGAALYDGNFLGSGDMATCFGMYGSDGWIAGLIYMKTPRAAGEFGFSAMGLFTRQDSENTDQTGKDVLRRYNKLSLHPNFSVLYSVTESITASLNLSWQYVGLPGTENPIAAPQNGIHAIGLSPRISIRTSSWDGYLLSEKGASLEYSYRFIFGEDNAQGLSLGGVFNHSLIPGFRVTAKAGVELSSASSSPFFENSLSWMINIVSMRYAVLNCAVISAGLEKYLFKFPFGTIAVAVAYQAAYSDGVFLHNQFDHGPAATMQMYFSRIALPGIGLGAAYNLDKKIFRFAINLGMSIPF